MDPNSNISVYGPKTASEYFVTPLTHGGYVFTTYTLTPDSNITFSFNMFDDSDKLVSLESKPINFPGVFAILSNNTLLLAQPETTNSWSLLVEELPRIAISQDHGYGNLQVNSSIPKINSVIPLAINSISITYYDQVDLSNGNITIYQIIDSKHAIIRQLVTGDNNQYCSLSSDGNSVIMNVISSTFISPGQKYYVQVDTDFVKSRSIKDPLLGVQSCIWQFSTDDISTNNMHTGKKLTISVRN